MALTKHSMNMKEWHSQLPGSGGSAHITTITWSKQIWIIFYQARLLYTFVSSDIQDTSTKPPTKLYLYPPSEEQGLTWPYWWDTHPYNWLTQISAHTILHTEHDIRNLITFSSASEVLWELLAFSLLAAPSFEDIRDLGGKNENNKYLLREIIKNVETAGILKLRSKLPALLIDTCYIAALVMQCISGWFRYIL